MNPLWAALLRSWHWPAPLLLLVACWVLLARVILSFGPLGDAALWSLGLPAALLAEGRAAGGAGSLLALPQPLLPMSHHKRLLYTTLLGLPLVAGLWLAAGLVVPQPGMWWPGPQRDPLDALWWLPGTVAAFGSARLAPRHLARVLPWLQLIAALMTPPELVCWLAPLVLAVWLGLGTGPLLPQRTGAAKPVSNEPPTVAVQPSRPLAVTAQAARWGLIWFAASALTVALQTAAQALALRGPQDGLQTSLRVAGLLAVVLPVWLGRSSLACFLPPLQAGLEPGLLLPVAPRVWWRCTAVVTFGLAATLLLAVWTPLHTALAQGWFRGTLPLSAALAPLGLAVALTVGLQGLRRGWQRSEAALLWLAGGVVLALWRAAAVPGSLGAPLVGPLQVALGVVAALWLVQRLARQRLVG